MAIQEEHKLSVEEGREFWHAPFKIHMDNFRNKMDDMTELNYLKDLIIRRKEGYIAKGQKSLAIICDDELFFINRRFKELGYDV